MNKMELLNKELQEEVVASVYKGKRLVFGDGNITAKIIMVGEAPGADEEKQGRPFVGKAGKNLEEFLSVVGLNRNDIYITNVVKIRPTALSKKTGNPINRTPSSEEIQFFSPYLKREIDTIKPQIVVTLGNVPLKAVLEDKGLIVGNYHGKLILKSTDITVFPLYHPAAIIYNASLKEVYHEDLLKLRELL